MSDIFSCANLINPLFKKYFPHYVVAQQPLFPGYFLRHKTVAQLSNLEIAHAITQVRYIQEEEGRGREGARTVYTNNILTCEELFV